MREGPASVEVLRVVSGRQPSAPGPCPQAPGSLHAHAAVSSMLSGSQEPASSL